MWLKSKTKNRVGLENILLQKAGPNKHPFQVTHCTPFGLLLTTVDANKTHTNSNHRKTPERFFMRIPAIRELNYWEQLQHMKMLSLQRRLERYRIIYTWKTLEGLVPNCGVSVSHESGRNGRKCQVPSMDRKAICPNPQRTDFPSYSSHYQPV